MSYIERVFINIIAFAIAIVAHSLYRFYEHRFWTRTSRPLRRSDSLLIFLLLEVFSGWNLYPLLFFIGGFRPFLHWFLCRRRLRTPSWFFQPLARIRGGPRCRLLKALTTLIHDSLVFVGIYLFKLLYHPATQEILEGIEVTIGILCIPSLLRTGGRDK